MDWKEIKTQADADSLMDVFGGFHDSCIREAHLWTEHYVQENLSMSCTGDLDNRMRILVQRQARNPAAIELLFEMVTRINLVPSAENYDSIIFEATLLVKDGNIFWSPDCDANTLSTFERENVTSVSAKKLKWREVDWLGDELRYGPNDNLNLDTEPKN